MSLEVVTKGVLREEPSLTPQNSAIGNRRFQNAINRIPQSTPPIWFMRQAGRYHSHYQALRRKYSFVELCKHPQLAAEVALGPIRDFDFDAAILFSDLLFPLEALGFGLSYTDHGPQLDFKLNPETLRRLRDPHAATDLLVFQAEALRLTRLRLPADKSLIGFVGGPWTLFVYAVEGSHKNLERAPSELGLFEQFCEKLIPLIISNIQLQFENGAEVVMVFDTAAGELQSELFKSEVVPQLELVTQRYRGRLAYYSKNTTSSHLNHSLFQNGSWGGIAVDHHWNLLEAFELFGGGFIQGNFDERLLLSDPHDLKEALIEYLRPLAKTDHKGWVCGLGHGVLPTTPEVNVRLFVDTVREVLR